MSDSEVDARPSFLGGDGDGEYPSFRRFFGDDFVCLPVLDVAFGPGLGPSLLVLVRAPDLVLADG